MNKYKAIKVNGVKHDEHRYIMEKHLGRKLTFNECVHHIDGDKSNNELSNLEVVMRSEHSRSHMKGTIPSNRKLSKEDVDFIRKKYKSGDSVYGGRPLGRRFNVSETTIRYVIKRKTYAE